MAELINNPYATVDWGAASQLKVMSHLHPSKLGSQQDIVDAVEDAGVDFAWMGDRGDDQPPWPWDAEPSGTLFQDAGTETRTQTDEYEDYHWDEDNDDHMITMYSDKYVPDDFVKEQDDVIETVGADTEYHEDGGLVYLAHTWDADNPRDYDYYLRIFSEWSPSDGLLGGSTYTRRCPNPEDDSIQWDHREREGMWDDILTELAPEYVPYLLTEDDAETLSGDSWDGGFDLRWLTIPVTDVGSLSEERPPEINDALRSGAFISNYRTDKSIDPPTVNAIYVDEDSKEITVDASGYDYIDWVSNGEVIHTGSTFDYGSNSDLGAYVRPRLVRQENPESGSLIQPFTFEGAPRDLESEFSRYGVARTGLQSPSDGRITLSDVDWNELEHQENILVDDGPITLEPPEETDVPESTIAHYDAQSAFGEGDDGTSISTWTDEYNGFDLTGDSPTLRADGINGYQSVEFDGSGDVLNTDTGANDQPITVFAVVELLGGESDHQIFWGDNSSDEFWMAQGASDGWNSISTSEGDRIDGNFSTQGEAIIMVAVFDGSNSFIRENGEETASGNLDSDVLEGLSIGDVGSRDNNWHGLAGEFLVVGDRLDTDQIQEWEEKLSENWDISI
ncbi:hypothetical protein [Natronorubrum texcoconense]|uniref:Concanavalin A-like lectin/glucanases superfamily protein n=1 Tax=Natronorubrum texcoconense TaxID=1095776 RepID=A0A1G9H7F7_9EURY|nr:hypothetical protein [Natronorubrum texcoconense]SDL08822.1 hypothetical protein SAMN04515672_0132 [Natronorubrum texcoconense]